MAEALLNQNLEFFNLAFYQQILPFLEQHLSIDDVNLYIKNRDIYNDKLKNIPIKIISEINESINSDNCFCWTIDTKEPTKIKEIRIQI